MMAAAAAPVTYQIECWIRGYKVYGHLASVKNSTLRKHGNQHDHFAVAVLKEGMDSHLPREISRECLKMDRIIDVEVTGNANNQAFLKGSAVS